jgi:chromosome segregation ATPase
MKNIILLFMISAMALLLLVSCAPSVPKSEYDKTLSDLSAAQNELSNLQTQIETLQVDFSLAKTQVVSLQNELSASQAKINSLQEELSTTQNQLIVAQSHLSLSQEKIKKITLMMDINNDILLPSNDGQILTKEQLRQIFNKWANQIYATHDYELIEKYNACKDNIDNPQILSYALNDYFVYIWKKISNTI